MPEPTPRIGFDEAGRKVYRPGGATLKGYLRDRSHVSIIRGPIGSGTSSASCMKIYMLAMEQRQGVDGIRRSRWAVVRNSYPDLKNTTIRTWLDWFPEEQYGKFWWDKPMHHEVRIGDVELDVHFMALDQDDDVRKLRSLELTGVWFNELEYINKAIFDEAESRTGRFPAQKDGGTAWNGVLGDMNAPNEDHWLPMMSGEVPFPDEMGEEERHALRWPTDWEYFVQPPALVEIMAPDGKTVAGYKDNPEGENLQWLKPGFYQEKLQGKSKAWIDSRLMNRITFFSEGSRVWPMFRIEMHVATGSLVANPNYPLDIGLDFGRRPAAVVTQKINNRLLVLAEYRGYDMGAATFAPRLKGFLATKYPGMNYTFWGDPKGQDRGQGDERTAYEIFATHGMTVRPAPVKNNNLEARLGAVENVLNGMSDGLPRFVLDPHAAPTLKAGMAGRYCTKKDATTGKVEPIKDKYSDVADALQYVVLGQGEGQRLVGRDPDHRVGAKKVIKPQRSLRRVG
jgi:hypothetical protein